LTKRFNCDFHVDVGVSDQGLTIITFQSRMLQGG
jgi:hypothetical protein